MNRYSRKPGEPEARRRLEAFWTDETADRPAISAIAPDPDYTPSPYPTEGRDRKELDLSPEYHAHAAADCMRGGLFLAESMPHYTVTVGRSLGLPGVLVGADYTYDDRTAWLHEIPGILDGPPPRFNPEETCLPAYLECVAAASDRVGEMGFINPPCLLDPVTTLSQLAGPADLAIALLERPDVVDAWVEEITRLSLVTYRQHAKAADLQDSAPFWGPATPGLAQVLQCDFCVMVSPEMFGRHVMPMLRRIAEPMERTLYHLDGVDQMRFLDHLQQIPELKGIQWNPETHYAEPTHHLDDLREIRERGLVLFLTVDSTAEAVAITRELGPDGLYLKFPALFESATCAEDAIAAVADAAARG
jgi:hypothetical protein